MSRMEQELKEEHDGEAARQAFATARVAATSEEHGESQLKLSTLTKATAPVAQAPAASVYSTKQRQFVRGVSPGGTTDSLQFSQSIALSNLATTIRGAAGPQGPGSQRPASQRSRSKEPPAGRASSKQEQQRALEFGDLGNEGRAQQEEKREEQQDPELITLQRSQFLFSGISNLNEKMDGGLGNDSRTEDMPLPNRVHGP